MKLFFFPRSPNSRKVWATALALDINLDLQLVDLLTGQQRDPAYLKLNPNGLTPTLQDGDFVLWESNAIMQYLASKMPNNLWPQDQRVRADISRWQNWELAHWGKAVGTVLFERLVKPLALKQEPDPAEIRKGEEAIHRFAPVLDQHLDGRRYLVGETLTLADFSVAPFVAFKDECKLPLEKYNNINRWYAQIERLDAWKKSAPPPVM
jgi:glutathione S-transferase